MHIFNGTTEGTVFINVGGEYFSSFGCGKGHSDFELVRQLGACMVWKGLNILLLVIYGVFWTADVVQIHTSNECMPSCTWQIIAEYIYYFGVCTLFTCGVYISICFFINEQVSIISSRQTPVWLCTISMMYEYTCMRINRTCKYLLRMSACAHTNKHTWVHACSHHKKRSMHAVFSFDEVYVYIPRHTKKTNIPREYEAILFFRTIWGHTFLEQYEPILVYFQKYT